MLSLVFAARKPVSFLLSWILCIISLNTLAQSLLIFGTLETMMWSYVWYQYRTPRYSRLPPAVPECLLTPAVFL
ncbi:hypothetical protein OE88DRAFT_1650159 [Heliocybe sulcata]|uniref:Uncharacterized protein n=1 Tax=Heliocybe sulcata TaxID=5364 RepID=A0A5C3NIS1_9AGAM|nr:hypothetical protein OE88DRAFT_1650159 [Heliocybe sulcata]